MNCDQAFDQLTALDRPHSLPLQAHLAECQRCRHMQETLSPALSLFAAADHSGTCFEPGEPPVFLSSEAVQVAESAARQLATRAQTPALNFRHFVGILLRSAALLVLGAVLTLGTLQGDKPEARPTAAVPGTPPDAPCRRIQIAQATPTSAPLAARNAVLSCVACHLAATH